MAGANTYDMESSPPISVNPFDLPAAEERNAQSQAFNELANMPRKAYSVNLIQQGNVIALAGVSDIPDNNNIIIDDKNTVSTAFGMVEQPKLKEIVAKAYNTPATTVSPEPVSALGSFDQFNSDNNSENNVAASPFAGFEANRSDTASDTNSIYQPGADSPKTSSFGNMWRSAAKRSNLFGNRNSNLLENSVNPIHSSGVTSHGGTKKSGKVRKNKSKRVNFRLTKRGKKQIKKNRTRK